MDEIAIKVDSVSKEFKLPHEKQTSIKSMFVNLFRGKRTYERQRVLKNISFEIKKGEFFGIVGRNGSGKSTLLKLLAGIYFADSGRISVEGSLTPFIELGVGFNPELTGRENVYLNGALLGFNRKEVNEMYQDIVEFSELERFMDQKLKNYSSGMQVRLAFAIAIRAKSSILLIDEVLAVGDAAFQIKCFDYFERLKEEKRTIVLVSHDMASIKRFCTSGILIDEGSIIKSGDINEVATAYSLLNKPKAESVVSGKKNSRLLKTRVNLTGNKLLVDAKYVLGNEEYSEPPVLGISILNQQGIYIAGFNNHDEKRDKLSGAGRHTVQAEVDLTNLLPNDYLINVSLYTSDFQLIDHLNYAGAFSVAGKPRKSKDGAYNIPVGWIR